MVDNIVQYIEQIENKIATGKQSGKNKLYEFSIDFGEHRAEYCGIIKKYFQDKGISVEIRFCQQCGSREADIIICW